MECFCNHACFFECFRYHTPGNARFVIQQVEACKLEEWNFAPPMTQRHVSSLGRREILALYQLKVWRSGVLIYHYESFRQSWKHTECRTPKITVFMALTKGHPPLHLLQSLWRFRIASRLSFMFDTVPCWCNQYIKSHFGYETHMYIVVW